MLIYILAGLCAVSLMFAYGAFMMQTHALDEVEQALKDLNNEYGGSYNHAAEVASLKSDIYHLKSDKSELSELCKFLLSKEKSDKFFIYEGHMYAKYSAELKEEPSGKKILEVEFMEVNV